MKRNALIIGGLALVALWFMSRRSTMPQPIVRIPSFNIPEVGSDLNRQINDLAQQALVI